MVLVLAALLVCASMLAIYAFVRTEEHRLADRRKDAVLPLRHGSKNN